MEKTKKVTEVSKDAALRSSFAEIKKAAAKTSADAKVKEPVKDTKPAAPAEKTMPKKKAAAAKKPVKKAPKADASMKLSVTLQINGQDFPLDDLKARVQAEAAARKADVAEVQIYINAAEGKAYFTLDGEGSDDYFVAL